MRLDVRGKVPAPSVEIKLCSGPSEFDWCWLLRPRNIPKKRRHIIACQIPKVAGAGKEPQLQMV